MDPSLSDIFQALLALAFVVNLLIVTRLYYALKVTNARITILSNLVKAQRRAELGAVATPTVAHPVATSAEPVPTRASVPVAITRVPADVAALLQRYEEQERQLQVQLKGDFTYAARGEAEVLDFLADDSAPKKP